MDIKNCTYFLYILTNYRKYNTEVTPLYSVQNIYVIHVQRTFYIGHCKLAFYSVHNEHYTLYFVNCTLHDIDICTSSVARGKRAQEALKNI